MGDPMNWNFSEISESLLNENKGNLLVEVNFGLERESQRVISTGELALTPHPTEFGDKLENERITTDFSESQIEIITPPCNSAEEVFDELNKINSEVENSIGDELLWPLSMPPKLPDEKDIPIAIFSNSDNGKYKEIYRKGLSIRYGKKMQMISGIHYNFSFGEGLINYLYKEFGESEDKRLFIDKLHFQLARNFLRYSWLLVYLFGASPSCHSTYFSVINKEIGVVHDCCPRCAKIIKNADQNTETEENNENKFSHVCVAQMNKYATSLRVSRFGYSNSLKSMNIYFNSLEEYSEKIRKMISTQDEEYLNLGIFKDGSQIQLNGNILQNENEFYSSIRLKQPLKTGETPLEALENRGVEYVELRILDLNPFEKLGLSLEQMNFIHVFMLFCLFEPSPLITEKEHSNINSNHHLVSLFGRKDNLKLQKYNDNSISLKTWAEEIFEKLSTIAHFIDTSTGDNKYLECVEKEKLKLDDVSLLPSEQINREMEFNNENYLEFGMKYAKKNAQESKITLNSDKTKLRGKNLC
jgi:glutamate--cysteine ligase